LFRPPAWLIVTTALIAFLVGGLLTFPVYALPAGFQEYYILGNETQVFRMFQTIQANEGGSIGNPYMASVVTIVATADHQVVYYDHWEDGYEPDILNPVQASTEVYGDGNPANGGTGDDVLRTGDIISLNSDGGTGVHQYVPVAPRGTELRYDSSDRLVSLGGPIDIVHSLWPSDSTWIGGAWEVYPTGAWPTGCSYIVPIGTDLYDGPSGYFADFKYVWLEIQALDDNTTVYIDNGSEAVSVRLERGQTYSSMGYLDSITATIPAITINGGTTILANKPLQVGLVTGGDGTFQTRFYTLVPDTAWSTEYVAPIPRTTANEKAEVYLFNPDDKDHVVTAYDTAAPTGTSFILTATTSLAYHHPTAAGHYVPAFSALRLRSDGPLWAIASADTTSTNYDWGFAFVPTRFATRDYYISWAPGTEDRTANGSPVWVAPLSDNTAFSVDYSTPTADGTPDEHFVLDALQTRRIFDPDNDNTGMHIWADKPFVAIWGEDALTAEAGQNFLDLGYSVLPPHPDWLNPVLTLRKTTDVQTLPPSGGTATFTLRAQAADYPQVSNVDITDTLPLSWTYVSHSAVVTYPDGTTAQVEPQINGRSLFWDLSATLDANQAVEVRFQAQLTMTGGLGDTRYDDLESGDYSGGFGWNGPWTEYEPGDCGGNCVDNTTDTTFGSPHSGSHHLIIRGSGAISRTADLSGFQQPALRLWRRLNALESDDAFYLRLYDGTGWTTVLTFTDTSGQDTYMAEQLDLTPYRSPDFALELRGGAANGQYDYLYLDDVEIFDAAAIQENTAEATGIYQGHLFSSRDEATIVLSPLSLHQEVDKAAVVGGDTLLYTLTYSNSSSVLTMTNVLIRDVLPANTTFLAASPGATYLSAAHAVVWGYSPTITLPPGASGIITVAVSVDPWVSNGQILRSTGYIDSDQTVEAASNPVETIALAPEVSLVKSGPPAANPGQLITYTIEYANTGPVTATGAIITDLIPLSTTYQTGSLALDTGSGYVPLTDADDGDAGRFTGQAIAVRPGLVSGQLAPGETGRIRFTVRISPTVPGGEDIANHATLARDHARPQNSSLLLTAVSDLTLEKTADRTVVGPGASIAYTLTLASGGAVTQTQVYVRDSIPAHTHYLSGTAIVPTGFALQYSTDHGGTWSSTPPADPTQVTDLRWYTPTIGGPADFTLGYRVQVEDPLSEGGVVIVNRAQVTSTQTPLIYSNEVNIQTVDLTVNKVHSGSPVASGARITYTITCGNSGSVAAPGTVVTDRVPPGTTLVPGSITGGGSTDGQVITWTVDLPAQATGFSMRFAVTVPPTATCGQPITNVTYIRHSYDADQSTPVVVTVTAPYTAAFTPSLTETCPLVPITFTNHSRGADSYLWDLGDGTITTTLSPVHAYTMPGTYTVVLTATSFCGTAVATATVHILPCQQGITVTGVVYADRDADGVFWPGLEPGIAGVPITATGGVTTTSGADGRYSLPISAPGSVVVSVTLPPGYTPTTSPVVSLTVQAGSVYRADFGALPPECAADAYEPDDTPAQATLLETTASQWHAFHAPGDTDWVAFFPIPSHIYTITTRRLEARADTTLTLFDADLNPLAVNDDYGPLDFSSRIVWTAPVTAGGIYYVQVTNVGEWPEKGRSGLGGCDTGYELILTEKPIERPLPLYQLYLPLVLKAPGGPPSPQYPDLVVESLAVEPASPQPGERVTITVVIANVGEAPVPLGDNFFTDLYVDPPAPPGPGQPGDYSWGCQALWMGLGSRYTLATTYAFPTAGQHVLYAQVDTDGFVEESDETNNLSSPLTITISQSTNSQSTNPQYPNSLTPQGVVVHVCPDAYERDDTPADSRLIQPGENQAHNFDGHTGLGVADKDWVHFAVQPLYTYTFTTSGLTPLADTVITLFAPDGVTVLRENDDDPALGEPGASRLVWTAPPDASGDYYLRVVNADPTAFEDCANTQVRYVLTLAASSPYPYGLYLPLVLKDG